MQLGSILAIYFVAWVFSAFIMLPIGVKTDEEVGADTVPGQAESAPHQFDLKRHLLKAAIVAAALTGLYVANYHYGWVEAEDLDFYG